MYTQTVENSKIETRKAVIIEYNLPAADPGTGSGCLF